ncbi:MAG: OmpA family protein [Thermoanaerobaculaceae bacterium]|jgi:outer membrane protein OmpA-like peptidoglycan-associated protein
MRRISVAALFTTLLASTVAAQQPLQDKPGFKDPGLFARIPGYFLSERSSFKESQFEAYEFWVRQGSRDVRQRVEGHLLVYYYYFDKSTGKPMPSALQIERNYQNAAVDIGGEVLYDGRDGYGTTTLRITKKGLESWAEIKTNGNGLGYYVTIIERQAMKQDVVANADALGSGLAATGHVEVPGIFFDFNKAEIKPESQPALEQVAKLLKGTPALRVWVVGHTDWVGSAETNTALSNARAAAVVRALAQQFAIDPKRLAPQGVGPYAPVAANTTDEGRAKNRRVELVAQP